MCIRDSFCTSTLVISTACGTPCAFAGTARKLTPIIAALASNIVFFMTILHGWFPEAAYSAAILVVSRPSTHAVKFVRVCRSPQAGQRTGIGILGRLSNTTHSVLNPVGIARPVLGQGVKMLAMTHLMDQRRNCSVVKLGHCSLQLRTEASEYVPRRPVLDADAPAPKR